MPHSLLSKTLLTLSLLATAATPVLAQPSAEPAAAAPGATQTHDWNEVSHVNGQLVPVGESNEYLKKFRRTNISSNPIGWMVGFYGVSVSHAISNHVAIRGDVNYISPVDSDFQMTEVGVGVPLYLRRTYQGPFLEPGAIVRTESSDYHDDGDSTLGPQVLFGWHWTWDSGFNVAVATGVGRNLNAADEVCDDYGCYEEDDQVFFNGYFRVGYAF